MFYQQLEEEFSKHLKEGKYTQLLKIITDLADIQLISKFGKRLRSLSCAIVIYGKHAWVALLKNKNVITITNVISNKY